MKSERTVSVDSEKMQDESLAAFTDAVMQGKALEASDEIKELEMAVRHLHNAIAAGDGPPAQLRTSLQRALADEFDRVHREDKIVHLQRRRVMRMVSVAAAVLVVAAVGLLLGTAGEGDTVGTGSEGDLLIIGGILAAFLAGGAFYWYRQNRP